MTLFESLCLKAGRRCSFFNEAQPGEEPKLRCKLCSFPIRKGLWVMSGDGSLVRNEGPQFTVGMDSISSFEVAQCSYSSWGDFLVLGGAGYSWYSWKPEWIQCAWDGDPGRVVRLTIPAPVAPAAVAPVAPAAVVPTAPALVVEPACVCSGFELLKGHRATCAFKKHREALRASMPETLFWRGKM